MHALYNNYYVLVVTTSWLYLLDTNGQPKYKVARSDLPNFNEVNAVVWQTLLADFLVSNDRD